MPNVWTSRISPTTSKPTWIPLQDSVVRAPAPLRGRAMRFATIPWVMDPLLYVPGAIQALGNLFSIWQSTHA